MKFSMIKISFLAAMIAVVISSAANAVSDHNDNGFNRSRLKLQMQTLKISDGNSVSTSRNSLKEMITKLRSVRLKPRTVAQPQNKLQAVVAAGSDEINLIVQQQIKNESNSNVSPAQNQNEAEKPQTEQPGVISEQTLQRIKTVSENPSAVNNPYRLAEVLFVAGNKELAAIFYAEALRRIQADAIENPAERAWIIFQIANCLEQSDTDRSAQMYRKVITEYPDSEWAQIAKVKEKLAEWYKENKQVKLAANK